MKNNEALFGGFQGQSPDKKASGQACHDLAARFLTIKLIKLRYGFTIGKAASNSFVAPALSA